MPGETWSIRRRLVAPVIDPPSDREPKRIVRRVVTWHPTRGVSTLEGATGERLSKTVLRDFGQPIPHEERDYNQPSYRVTLLPNEAPVPVLLRHALTLTGIRHNGPGERKSLGG